MFHIYLTLTLLACGHGLVPLTYLTYACESLAWGMQYSSYLFVRLSYILRRKVSKLGVKCLDVGNNRMFFFSLVMYGMMYSMEDVKNGHGTRRSYFIVGALNRYNECP